MAAPNLDAFLAEVRKLNEAVPRAHAKAHAHLVETAFGDVVEGSPVQTGEYRASHTIGLGVERVQSFLFEHPERPEPDAPARPRETPIPAPDVGAAASTLQTLAPFQSVVLENPKFYAGFLEYGTARMVPRLIYERARANTEGRMAEAESIFFEELGVRP